MKISIVMATYNRATLLERSLRAYQAQSGQFQEYELIIVDDGSTDETQALLNYWKGRLVIHSLQAPPKEPGRWRDCASVINQGLRAAQGEVVLLTHPEVMVGQHTLACAYEALTAGAPNLYFGAKVYYLTPQNQQQIEWVRWTQSLLAVRELPNFYSEHPDIQGPASEYTHEATDRHAVWESWVFGGMCRALWQTYGPMTEFEQWGSVDMDFLARRQVAGIETYTPLDPEAIVVHQNHDVAMGNSHHVATPRDMDKAMAGSPAYPSRESALKGPVWQA